MIYDQSALRTAQRLAYDDVALPSFTANGRDIAIPPVAKTQITAPATIRQEVLYNNLTSVYIFRFGAGRDTPAFLPDPAGLTNINLGDNDIISAYGIQLEIGVGANIIGRVYNAFGTTANDNALYAGNLAIKWASNEPVENMSTNMFLETSNANGLSGFQFIRPIRKWVGSISQVLVTITIPNLTGVALTANQHLRVTFHGAIGVA